MCKSRMKSRAITPYFSKLNWRSWCREHKDVFCVVLICIDCWYSSSRFNGLTMPASRSFWFEANIEDTCVRISIVTMCCTTILSLQDLAFQHRKDLHIIWTHLTTFTLHYSQTYYLVTFLICFSVTLLNHHLGVPINCQYHTAIVFQHA